MVASVSKTLEDEINNDTSFHFCNKFSKWSKMLVKQKVIGVFKKMLKHVLKTRNRIWCHLQGMAIFIHATCKYYCPLVVDPTITNIWKELHLKHGRVFRSVFENVTMHKNWKTVFLLIFKYCHLYRKSLFFSVTFYSMMKYFWSAF